MQESQGYVQRAKVFDRNISVDVLRLDQYRPAIGGNKYFKLKYNLSQARNEGKSQLLTFGGAFSNHILATAQAGKLYGFQTIGIIRGELPSPLNPTLALAKDLGMLLISESRSAYREKAEQAYIRHIQSQYPEAYLIPEGGSNALAVEGCKEIWQLIDKPYDVVALAAGTGATAAGIIAGNTTPSQVWVFPALKGDFMADEIRNFLPTGAADSKWKVVSDYHFGGYAKWSPRLVDFINGLKEETGIPSDPIYTGKLFYGLWDMISQGKMADNFRILAIHTGGLQGIAGFNQRFGDLIH